MLKQYKIIVSGRVQGVGFRHAASGEARRLGLMGWVENLPDGTVLSVVQGLPDACKAYIAWCHRGPGYSWVEKVRITEVPLSDDRLPPFRVRY